MTDETASQETTAVPAVPASRSSSLNEPKGHVIIKDLSAVFRFSGMVDQLRDAAAMLLSKEGAEVSAVPLMVNRYRELRSLLAQTLHEKFQEEFENMTPELEELDGGEAVNLGTLFYAAGALSQYMTLMHQTPYFLDSETMKRFQTETAISQIGVRSALTDDESEDDQDANGNVQMQGNITVPRMHAEAPNASGYL